MYAVIARAESTAVRGPDAGAYAGTRQVAPTPAAEPAVPPGAGTTLVRRRRAVPPRLGPSLLRRARCVAGDAGMATAEYAIATLAAVGFAGLLVVILKGNEVKGLLLGIIRQALSL